MTDRPPEERPAPVGPSTGAKGASEPELRLHDRKAYVGFGATPIAAGIRVSDFAMRVPEISYPFDISGSAATRYQKKRCTFGYLTLEVEADVLSRSARSIHAAAPDRFGQLTLSCRAGCIEGSGTLIGGDAAPAPFTFRVGFSAETEEVLALVFDVRMYADSGVPAGLVAPLLAAAVEKAEVLPGAKRQGASGLLFSPLPELLRRVVPARGFRIPDVATARLAGVDVTTTGLKLRFAE